MKASTFVFGGLLLVLVLGCKSIGPPSVARDRFSYSAVLGESWKNQMLLNLVKTRYLDLPIYLEVGQIVSSYTLETTGSVGGTAAASSGASSPGYSATLGVATRYADRPTITYTPLTGTKFLEGFLAPIEPAKVFSLVQAGYAADFILELSVDSLSGLRNRPASIEAKHHADPEFFRALSLLRDVQDAGAVGMRVERPTNALPITEIFFRSDRVQPVVQAKIAEVKELLGLAPEGTSYRLVPSPLRGEASELTVSTRSLSQMMGALSLGVQVPPPHAERNLAPPIGDAPAAGHALLRVHSGLKEPDDAFVAVPYEGEWFWIASDDWISKRTFSSILFLFTLADTGSIDRLPVLTIPAN